MLCDPQGDLIVSEPQEKTRTIEIYQSVSFTISLSLPSSTLYLEPESEVNKLEELEETEREELDGLIAYLAPILQKQLNKTCDIAFEGQFDKPRNSFTASINTGDKALELSESDIEQLIDQMKDYDGVGSIKQKRIRMIKTSSFVVPGLGQWIIKRRAVAIMFFCLTILVIVFMGKSLWWVYGEAQVAESQGASPGEILDVFKQMLPSFLIESVFLVGLSVLSYFELHIWFKKNDLPDSKK